MPIYMNYDGIQGSVTEQGHEKWVELQSFQWGIGRAITSATGRGTNREASTPSVSEIVCTKNQDDASIKLFQAALWGEGKNCTIDFVKTASGGQQELYMQVKMEETLISSYSTSAAGGEATGSPMESFSLNFAKVEYNATLGDKSNKQGGSNKAGWDLAKSAKV